MSYIFTMVCPKCNKTSTVSADKRVPEPAVSCGDCLMDHVEVVRMKVLKVEDTEPPIGKSPIEAAAPLLLAALIKALHELHHELDRRKNSGNDEDYAELEALCQECARAIVSAAPNAIKPKSLGAAAVTAITPRMSQDLLGIGITDLESPLLRFTGEDTGPLPDIGTTSLP